MLAVIADQIASESSTALSPQWLHSKPVDTNNALTAGALGVWKFGGLFLLLPLFVEQHKAGLLLRYRCNLRLIIIIYLQHRKYLLYVVFFFF